MRRFLAIAAAASALMLTSAAGAPVSASPQSIMSEETVKTAVNDLFAAQCEVIKGGTSDRLLQAYGTTAEARQRVTYDAQYLVKQYVEPYAYNKYVISGCRYELHDLQITTIGSGSDVTVTPILLYEWGRPEWNSTVTTSESEGTHRIKIALVDGQLKVIRHDYRDFFNGNLPTKPFVAATVYKGDASAKSANSFIPTQKEDWTLTDKLKEEQRKTSSVTIQSTATYDWLAAAAYARTWAQKTPRNTNYPDYGNNDCTNFVSASIHDSAGGKAPFFTGWNAQKGIFGWSSTPTWRLVVDFRNMVLAGSSGPHGTWVGYPNSLLKGDLMIFKLSGSSDWIHNTIVTNYAPDGTNLLSYHSTDTLDRPWNTIVADAITAISMDATFNYP